MKESQKPPTRKELLELLVRAKDELAASTFRNSLTLIKIKDALKRAGVS